VHQGRGVRQIKEHRFDAHHVELQRVGIDYFNRLGAWRFGREPFGRFVARRRWFVAHQGSSLIAGPPRNREHQSTGREEHQCRGPAVTQQWQGMPVTGMMPIVIPMFSKQLKAKKTNTPMQMIRPSCPWPGARFERAERHEGEQQDDQQRPDEAQLLPDGGEYEVRVLFRHVPEIRLQTVEEPDAVEATRANGVLGVVDVIDVLRPLRLVES